jgi:hypothetical protein
MTTTHQAAHVAVLEWMLTVYPLPDFAREHEAITAAIELMKQAGWQSIETAPKDGTRVLVGVDTGDPWGFVRGHGRYENYGKFVQGWVCRGFCDPPGELGLAHPTHWMPLPAAPTEASR